MRVAILVGLILSGIGVASATTLTGAPLDAAHADSASAPPTHRTVSECAAPRADWVWCDDFDEDRLARYFEYDSAKGAFSRTASAGRNGSYAMRARWAPKQTGVGHLHLALGRTPQSYMKPVDGGTATYRELFWRVYVRNQAGWIGGGGDKLSRAFVFASPSTFAQAMISHVWSAPGNVLTLDPARGTDAAGALVTTTYNDFKKLTWLGATPGRTPLFDAAHVGRWYCIEAHVKLNDPGLSNGVNTLWIDGALEAQKSGINWLGAFSAYGLNAVYLENYWNNGSPVAQERAFDNFVVSTKRIGCAE